MDGHGCDAQALELQCLSRLESLEAQERRNLLVHHPVPTFGFIVDWGEGQVVFSSDTGPTEEIWQRASECASLRAVFIETSFPDELADLALTTGHLTPATLAQEVAKIPGTPRTIIVHMKPAFHDVIVAELEALEIAQLEVGLPGTSYYL